MNDKDFSLIGYYPSWKKKKIDMIRYDKLSHLIYAFASVDKNSKELAIQNIDNLKEIVRNAKNSNTSVILSVGGWDENGKSNRKNLYDNIKDENAKEKLIDNIVKIAIENTLSGIDVCYGYLEKNIDEIKAYNSFLCKLGSKLKEKKLTLSVSVLGEIVDEKIISYDMLDINDEFRNAVDWVNVIQYSPVEGARKSTLTLDVADEAKMNEFIELPKEISVVGMPFFAQLSLISYNAFEKKVKKDEIKQNIISCGREVYITSNDDIESRIKWAKKHTKGVCIWEVTNDAYLEEKSLIENINNVINSEE